jgi:diketogulonate reductase-like aldo/keto reductase
MFLKPLANTSTQIPEIAFGTWNYTGGLEPLRALVAEGPCFIDTAESYGTEPLVGEAIRGARDRVFLATKASPRHFRRRDLIEAAEGSLRRLGTDYIDLYQLHWPNELVPIGETMQAMAQLAEAGKIRFIGVSNFDPRGFRAAQAALPNHHIVADQVRYSLVERTIERGLLPMCRQAGVTILAFSPLGSGVSNLRAADPEGVLPRVASMLGKSEAQVALNWVTSKESVVALTRASTVERVRENLGASAWRLPPEAVQLLDTKIRFRSRGPFESAARRLTRAAFQLLGKEQ